MLKSRFARGLIAAIYAVVMMAASFVAIILMYETSHRIARVVEQRPEYFVALGLGFFLSYGMRHRLHVRRKPWRWVAAWWAALSLLPIVATLYAAGLIRVPTDDLWRVAVFFVLGVGIGVLGAVYALVDDRHRVAPVPARRLGSPRGSWGWGAFFAAVIASMMAGSLLLSALMEGGWASHRREVAFAALILSATAGFLAVRLLAERSRIGTLGWRLGAGTFVSILLLLVCVTAREKTDRGDIRELLPLVAGLAALMTASATWLRRLRFHWMSLAPADDGPRGSRRAGGHELRELNARIRRDPRDTNALADRSRVLLARGESQRALHDLTRAMEFDRENAPRLLYARHLVHLSRDDFAPAMQDILAAIEIDGSRREDFFVAAALVYVKWGRLDGVAAMLEKLGLPAARAYSVQVSALKAALFDIDREIAGEKSRMSERYWDGDRSRQYSLDQKRSDIRAKLRGPRETPPSVRSGR